MNPAGAFPSVTVLTDHTRSRALTGCERRLDASAALRRAAVPSPWTAAVFSLSDKRGVLPASARFRHQMTQLPMHAGGHHPQARYSMHRELSFTSHGFIDLRRASLWDTIFILAGRLTRGLRVQIGSLSIMLPKQARMCANRNYGNPE